MSTRQFAGRHLLWDGPGAGADGGKQSSVCFCGSECSASGSNIGPIVAPTGLIFTSLEGTLPSSQTVLVQNTSSTPLNFHSGITTVDGGTWLGILPGDGTVTKAQPVPIVVQPDIYGLVAGVYRGSIALSFSDGSVRVIAVVVVVIPGSSTSQVSKARKGATRDGSGCNASTLVPVFTLLSSGFNAVAGFPGQVAVQVVDDCGAAMTTGDVITSFSNGDPPLRLTSLKDGIGWARGPRKKSCRPSP